eukprot:12408182-Karenia_brevis.AAC.1
MLQHGLMPRARDSEWARHIYRELNQRADALANKHAHYCYMCLRSKPQSFKYYRIFFDGSVARSGAGGGWVLYGCSDLHTDVPEAWTVVAERSFPMPKTATITACELEACVWAVAFLRDLLDSTEKAMENIRTWQPLDTNGFPVLQLAQLVT